MTVAFVAAAQIKSEYRPEAVTPYVKLEESLQATLAQLVERLIRNFHLSPYAIHSKVGHAIILSVYSAWRALIEPDFEPNYSILTGHPSDLDCAAHECADVISTAMGELNS